MLSDQNKSTGYMIACPLLFTRVHICEIGVLCCCNEHLCCSIADVEFDSHVCALPVWIILSTLKHLAGMETSYKPSFLLRSRLHFNVLLV